MASQSGKSPAVGEKLAAEAPAELRNEAELATASGSPLEHDRPAMITVTDAMRMAGEAVIDRAFETAFERPSGIVISSAEEVYIAMEKEKPR